MAAHFLCQLPVEHSKCWRRIFQFTPGTAPSCHCRFFTVNISDTSGARWYNNKAPCSVSSAGRANGSQPLGRRFEPATEHHDADNSAADARSSCSPGFFFALKQSSRCLCRPAASSCRLPLPAGCLFWPAASSCRLPLPAGCLFLPAEPHRWIVFCFARDITERTSSCYYKNLYPILFVMRETGTCTHIHRVSRIFYFFRSRLYDFYIVRNDFTFPLHGTDNGLYRPPISSIL